MRSSPLVALATTMALAGCTPGAEAALAAHLDRVASHDDNGCAALEWSSVHAVTGPLPQAARVTTLAREPGLAACGFGSYEPEDPADAGGGPGPAAVVVVTDSPADDAETFEATTMQGRLVRLGGELEGLGGEVPQSGVVKSLPVGPYALTVSVAGEHLPDVVTGDLLDAAAHDLGL